MSNVLITSGSGNIGVELVPLLVQSSSVARLVLPTSNATRLASSIQESEKITVIEGSISDPQWIEELISKHKINVVFLNLTGVDELFTTMNFLSCIQRSGCVEHVVYLSACGEFLSPHFRQAVLRNCSAAHVVVKVLVEQALEAMPRSGDLGGFTWTAIGPTLFMENDLRAKNAMLRDGIYPEPIGDAGVSRVATKDIALGVTKAIEDRGQKWDRKKFMIGSKKTYTGREIAAIWSEALGKPIRMQSADREGFDAVEHHFRGAVGPAWAKDLRLMYEAFEARVFGGKGFGMTDAEYEAQKELLGTEPASYEDFVKTTAAS